jgi:hypothetical protein
MRQDEEIQALIGELKAWASQKYGRSAFLARHFRVSKQLISAWFNGRAIPTWPMGIEIKKFLKANRPPPKKVATKT